MRAGHVSCQIGCAGPAASLSSGVSRQHNIMFDKLFVFKLVSIGLLVLGGVSGVTLFVKATFMGSVKPDEGVGHLWGLFIFCILVGVILHSCAIAR